MDTQNTIIEANIEITRANGLVTISVSMPTWNKQTDSGFVEVSIALLGIRTFARDQDDAERAISEAIQCFCIQADRFGRGLDKELEDLGWHLQHEQATIKLMDFPIQKNNLVMDQLMQAGEPFARRALAIA